LAALETLEVLDAVLVRQVDACWNEVAGGPAGPPAP
jgi:hypothetical protein